jgi:hypothetical protein
MNISNDILVGRQYVPADEAKCIQCRQPFKYGVNVFTKEGHAETKISGMCEKCFDKLFKDEDD